MSERADARGSDESGSGTTPGELEPPWDVTKTSGVDAWTQKRRLATAMRLVIERLVASDAPADELRTAADRLEAYAEHLESHPRLRRVIGHSEASLAGDVGAFFDQSPLIGLSNPLAPPITIAKTGDRTAAATVTFGGAYEGPPSYVHGGYVAAAFDEVLGYVQSLSGSPGFTGTLTVRYRAPTPLHEPLRFAAELVREEGRKIFAAGQLFCGDRLCAEAEAVFIQANPEMVAELFRRRDELEETRGRREDG